jgi:serine phosphatase RsbU (regulator of sigma subunit)
VEQVNLEVLEKNKIIEHKNKDITDSITYAQGIQEAILPPDDKFKKFLPDSFILFRPRDIVSGDFYWMEVASLNPPGTQTENNDYINLSNSGGGVSSPASGGATGGLVVLLAVCDCTGHGVPGGFVSMVGHNGLTRTVNEKGIVYPAKILDSASLMVEETFRKGKRKDGMDAILCALTTGDHSTTFLEFAGANNPLYLVRKRENGPLVDMLQNESPVADITTETHSLYHISPDKQPVGAYEFRQPFTPHRFHLKKGDTLYLSSDGYRDQFGGPKGKKFMAKNFKQVLISIQEKSMEEQHTILTQTIDNWMKDCEQNDDICVIGVRV